MPSDVSLFVIFGFLFHFISDLSFLIDCLPFCFFFGCKVWRCKCACARGGTPLQKDENGMAHETRRHRACAVSLVLCALVLLCVCPDTTAQSDDCVACRFTFGYSYEFFAGHHIEVRNTPDRRYFPTNGLLSFSLFIFLSPFYHLMRCHARAHASTGLSYQFWMFPYDVTSGRPQGIIGNLFAKDATLQYYNTGFYLHNDRLLFVSGPLDFGAETNCLSLSLCHFPSWHTLTAFCFLSVLSVSLSDSASTAVGARDRDGRG